MKKCFNCHKEKEDLHFEKQYRDGTLITWNKCDTCREEFIAQRFPNKSWTDYNLTEKKNLVIRKKAQLEICENKLAEDLEKEK